MKPGAIYTSSVFSSSVISSSVLSSSVFAAILCGTSCFAAGAATPAVDIPKGEVISVVPANPTPRKDGVEGSTPDLLARVRAANEELYSSLQSFVCNERMERFKGSLSGENARHIDTVTTKVSFENGIEHYTDILQDARSRVSISSVSGAWSEGEFGTLLQQTQTLLNTQPVLFRMYAELEGTAAAVYQVNISEENSPWDLEVSRHHYHIPFRTELWVSRATGEIMKIERISTAIPTRIGISEIRWGVTLQTVQLNEKSWLLPKAGSYAVLYQSTGEREWNELRFSDYHRYGSETALRFQ